ncbi:MAG: hypothetical protein COA69_07930 [Robiginitomaculum sp.]|nr:MAG: hypothetical protein COA69_07930 [Robiginitomaculum sp.]
MKTSLLLLAGTALLLGACATTTVKPATVVETTEPKVEKPKYKTLVYGEEKPLVCTTSFAAEGDLKDRPNMQVMWENYLYDRPAGIWGEIGGLVEVNGNLPFDQGQWTNACTVRLSHMLNKAGHKIPRQGNKTVSGGNKDQYYYRVADLEAYIVETFGEPDVAITDGTGNSFDLPNTPGLVLMDFPNASYTGHVTIWNGAGTVDGANIGGYRILFWHLPCFIPADRVQTAADNTPIPKTAAALP